ncbi:MAG TPA: MFS transporter [Anaerolineales bacterium]|nr:MFS transporter [Anaerolineales bacterium]
MTTARPASTSPFAVFRNRNFSLLWTGQLVETIGNSLTSLAASIYIYRLTGSALSVGLMLMATAAPSLLVGLFAGVFVDRYDRRKIMITADILRGVLIALVPVLVPLSVGWLYVVVMLISGISQFFDPAHESMLPEVASDEELAAANSLIAISSFGSTAVGFAAAGLIASAADINWAFYVNAMTFFFSAICVFLIRIKPIEAEEETSVRLVIQNLRAGVRQLFKTPILRYLFYVQVVVLISFGLSNTLLLPFALTALNATEFEYGLQEGLTSIGFVVGSLFMAKVYERLHGGAWLAISFLGMGLVGVVYSFLQSVPLAIALITFSGLFNAPSSIGRRVIVQRNTPPEMRGRVSSAFFVARDVLFLVGMGAAGLADYMDIRLLYLISALMLVGAGLLILFLPELGQSRAQWKRTLALLRGIEAAPRLGAGRPATISEVEMFISRMPGLAEMSPRERTQLASNTLVAEAPGGKIVVYRGETSDAAYFILRGSVGVGYIKDDDYVILNYLHEGDFFGEMAALTGVARTANIITEEDSKFLILPAKVMRQLTRRHPELNVRLHTLMGERLSQTELPRGTSFDQQLLRELRTSQPDMEEEPADTQIGV